MFSSVFVERNCSFPCPVLRAWLKDFTPILEIRDFSFAALLSSVLWHGSMMPASTWLPVWTLLAASLQWCIKTFRCVLFVYCLTALWAVKFWWKWSFVRIETIRAAVISQAFNPSISWAVTFDVESWLFLSNVYLCAMLATQFGSVDNLLTV